MKSIVKKLSGAPFLVVPLSLVKFFFRVLFKQDKDGDDSFNHPYVIF